MERIKKITSRADFVIPGILFLALCLFKILVVIQNRTLPLITDEFFYEKMSWQLLHNGGYRSVQYPMFYPALLTPAYLFGEHYYMAMKVLNVLYSSFVPVVAYLICRLYLKPKESGICAVFSAVIPFQYITPMCLMSENIYFPMLLLAIYLTLRKHKREILGDLLLGAVLGCMFMTRHITLTIIPVFALVWMMKQKELGKTWKVIFLRGALIVIALLVAYSPWLYNGLSRGLSLKRMIGFAIASKTNPEQLTMSRLLLSAGYYLCYFALILAPVLGLAIKSIRGLDTKKIYSMYNQLWVIVFGLAGAFFVAVTRHSWRAYYNYPEFIKVKGRYIIYFPVLFVILGAVVLFQKKPQFKHRWTNVVLTYILPAALIAMAFFVEVKQIFKPLPDGFIDTFECNDMRKIIFMGTAFVVVVPLAAWGYQFFYDFARESRKKYLPLVFAVLLLGVEIWGAVPYLERVHTGNENAKKWNQRHAREMEASLRELYDGTKMYVLAEDIPNLKIMKRIPAFYHMSNIVLTEDLGSIKKDIFYILTEDIEKYEDRILEEITSYQWSDKTYYLVKAEK